MSDRLVVGEAEDIVIRRECDADHPVIAEGARLGTDG
jgi:hypothetical protein